MSQPHVIVVGAGIVGASIAWHLAVEGASVTVCDSAAAGGLATAHSFAWINATWGNPEHYFRLRFRSMAEWSRLATDVPGLPFATVGGLCWDMPGEDVDRFLRQHGAWDYGLREVGRAEAERLEPRVIGLPNRAVYVAREAAAEPQEAARALLSDAAARGAVLRLDQPVTGLRRQGDRIVGVDTAAGPVIGDEVVVAAGVGTTGLLASAGLSLAVAAPPGLLVHTRPHARLLNGIVLAPALHMRQTPAGRILCGADFGGTDPGDAAADVAAALFAALRGALRGGEHLVMERYTIGYRPVPAGGMPMIGRVAETDGLFVAVMHSGITLAPAVGLFAAAELLHGRRDPLLARFAPNTTPERMAS